MGRINFQMSVPIGQDWRTVELLRTAILNCLTTIFHNNDFCQTVGTITSELLENAIKYGDWSRDNPASFQLKVDGDLDEVRVEVSNPVDEEGDGAQAVKDTLNWMKGFESLQDAYHARLRDLAERPGNGATKLGLVRIAYESGCTLQADVDDSNVLRIRAVSSPA